MLVALGDMQCSVLSILNSEAGNTAVLNISTSAQLSLPMPVGFSPPDSLSAMEYFPYFHNRSVVRLDGIGRFSSKLMIKTSCCASNYREQLAYVSDQ